MSFRSGYPEPKPGLFPEQETDPEISIFSRTGTEPDLGFHLFCGARTGTETIITFFKEPEPEVVRTIVTTEANYSPGQLL